MSDGNVLTARRYSPCSARKRSAGVSADSNADGVSPSTMTRTTGFGFAGEASVPGKRSEPCVALRRAGAQPCAECRHRNGLEVPEHGDERERRADERREREQEGRPTGRAAAPQRAADERRGPDRAARRTGRAADRFVPLAEHEPDRNRHGNGEDEPRDSASQHAGGGDADRGADAHEDPDRVPVPHAARLHTARYRAGRIR